jgi:tetratricopeptide (TPR) repeat protein
MEPPGQGTPELRFALRQGAMLLESQGEATPWAVVSDAYLSAGDIEASLRAAEAWSASAPKSKGPLYLVGDRLLRLGRASEAEGVYLRLLKVDRENAQAWLGYGRAIAANEPERAITAALEAFSLAPQNGASVRLLVESLLACGRDAEAADALASFLEQRPEERASFADLLARLPAQRPPL